MYYRVIKNGKVIDVLERIIYVKYQEKHDQVLICDIKEAEAILSSDGKYAWHIDGLYHFKPDNSVYIITAISKFDYDKYKKNIKVK